MSLLIRMLVTMTRRSVATGCWRASRSNDIRSSSARRASISASAAMTESARWMSASSRAVVARFIADDARWVISTSVSATRSSSSWKALRITGCPPGCRCGAAGTCPPTALWHPGMNRRRPRGELLASAVRARAGDRAGSRRRAPRTLTSWTPRSRRCSAGRSASSSGPWPSPPRGGPSAATPSAEPEEPPAAPRGRRRARPCCARSRVVVDASDAVVNTSAVRGQLRAGAPRRARAPRAAPPRAPGAPRRHDPRGRARPAPAARTRRPPS